MKWRCLPIPIIAALALWPVGAAQAAPDWDLGRHWDITVGGGALYGPTYEGADSLRPSPIPYFDFEWNDRFSLSSDDGLHFAFVNWKNLSFGFAGNAKLPRKASDDSALHHLGRVGLSLEAGGYIDYNPPGFDISLEVRHDIAGGHGGTVAEFNVRGQVPIGKSFVMEFGPNVNWASKNYMQSYFGITPSQSLNSGFKVFSPNGGLKDVGFTFSGAYLFNEHWRLLVEATYARLMDVVVDSPLIREKGDPNQYSFSVMLAYHF